MIIFYFYYSLFLVIFLFCFFTWEKVLFKLFSLHSILQSSRKKMYFYKCIVATIEKNLTRRILHTWLYTFPLLFSFCSSLFVLFCHRCWLFIATTLEKLFETAVYGQGVMLEFSAIISGTWSTKTPFLLFCFLFRNTVHSFPLPLGRLPSQLLHWLSC